MIIKLKNNTFNKISFHLIVLMKHDAKELYRNVLCHLNVGFRLVLWRADHFLKWRWVQSASKGVAGVLLVWWYCCYWLAKVQPPRGQLRLPLFFFVKDIEKLLQPKQYLGAWNILFLYYYPNKDKFLKIRFLKDHSISAHAASMNNCELKEYGKKNTLGSSHNVSGITGKK